VPTLVRGIVRREKRVQLSRAFAEVT